MLRREYDKNMTLKFNDINFIKITLIIVSLPLFFVSINFLQDYKLPLIIFFCIFLIIYNLIYLRKYRLNKTEILWLLSIFSMIFNLLVSINLVNSLNFIIVYSCVIVIFVMFPIQYIDFYFKKIVFSFTIILCLFTYFSFFFFSLFDRTVNRVLTPEAISYSRYFFSIGASSGISGQTGTNAFLLSVGLGIVIFSLRKFRYVLIPLFFGAILFSEKRALIVFCILSLFFVIFVDNNIKTVTKSKVSLAIISIFFTLAVFLKERLIQLFDLDQEDFTSGRINLIREAYTIFLDNKWFGIGIDNFPLVYFYVSRDSRLIDAHNVYIQLLSETGFFGFLIVCLCFTYPYIQTIKILRRTVNSNNIQQIRLSLFIQTLFLMYCFTGNPFYTYNFLLIYLLSLLLVVKGYDEKN